MNLFLFLAFVVSLLTVQGYRVSIVDYESAKLLDKTAQTDYNVKEYVTIIRGLKKFKPDIVVFPQEGLNTKNTPMYIPPVGTIIDTNNMSYEMLWVNSLADAAYYSKTYIIFDVFVANCSDIDPKHKIPIQTSSKLASLKDTPFEIVFKIIPFASTIYNAIYEHVTDTRENTEKSCSVIEKNVIINRYRKVISVCEISDVCDFITDFGKQFTHLTGSHFLLLEYMLDKTFDNEAIFMSTKWYRQMSYPNNEPIALFSGLQEVVDAPIIVSLLQDINTRYLGTGYYSANHTYLDYDITYQGTLNTINIDTELLKNTTKHPISYKNSTYLVKSFSQDYIFPPHVERVELFNDAPATIGFYHYDQRIPEYTEIHPEIKTGSQSYQSNEYFFNRKVEFECEFKIEFDEAEYLKLYYTKEHVYVGSMFASYDENKIICQILQMKNIRQYTLYRNSSVALNSSNSYRTNHTFCNTCDNKKDYIQIRPWFKDTQIFNSFTDPRIQKLKSIEVSMKLDTKYSNVIVQPIKYFSNIRNSIETLKEDRKAKHTVVYSLKNTRNDSSLQVHNFGLIAFPKEDIFRTKISHYGEKDEFFFRVQNPFKPDLPEVEKVDNEEAAASTPAKSEESTSAESTTSEDQNTTSTQPTPSTTPESTVSITSKNGTNDTKSTS